MFCEKYKKNVLVKDCEECHGWRKFDSICIKREFIWGVNDDAEPRWIYSYKKAKKINIDVSYYFDPDWEGNSHLKKSSVNHSNKMPIPKNIRWEVWERDNFTCKFCSSRKHLAIDHIIPESKGGELLLNNLQTLCKSCNSKKGNKITYELKVLD